MPIYEYECERCGNVTDIKHGFKETTNEACPKCGGSLKRLFNAAGIVFKGSGFYVNDSRKASGSESKAESKSDGAASSTPAKTDSPPKTDGGGKSDAAA